MGSDDWPDWLPGDWSVNIRKVDEKKVKCYVGPDGHKCYSKPQVFDYLKRTNKSIPDDKTENVDGPSIDLSAEPNAPNTDELPHPSPAGPPTKLTPRPGRRRSITADLSEGLLAGNGSSSEPLSYKRLRGDDSWLPAGWTMEDKFRKGGSRSGMKYKVYTDPVSGQKFFSRPQVLNFLAKTNRSASGQGALNAEPISALPISSWQENPATESDNSQMHEATEVEKKTEEKTERSDMNHDDTPNVNLTSNGTEVSKDFTNGSVEELKTNESGIENPKPLRSITGGSFSTPEKGFSVASKNNADWLPDGWLVDVRYKTSGMKYKIYKDPASGRLFYSKPQVLSYLGIADSSNSRKRKARKSSVAPDSSPNSTAADATHPKRSGRKKGKHEKAEYQEVITTSAAEGLPPGWIRETRTKIFESHTRNDQFYTDPATGYIFRSKVDALRFVETGDVNLCASRPKVKDKDGNEVFVYTNNVQKPATGPKTAGNTVNNSIEGNGAGQEKQGTGVNLEEQPDDGNLTFDIPEDENWADQCIDFAVKSLADEVVFNGPPTSGEGFQEENAGVKETTPTKVN